MCGDSTSLRAGRDGISVANLSFECTISFLARKPCGFFACLELALGFFKTESAERPHSGIPARSAFLWGPRSSSTTTECNSLDGMSPGYRNPVFFFFNKKKNQKNKTNRADRQAVPDIYAMTERIFGMAARAKWTESLPICCINLRFRRPVFEKAMRKSGSADSMEAAVCTRVGD